MFLLALLRNVLFFLLIPLSLISTAYLYLYPLFYLCAFPTPTPESSAPTNAYLTTLLSHSPFASYIPASVSASTLPPFRLLAIGDPQLEGSSSLDPAAASFPHYLSLLATLKSDEPLLPRTRGVLHDAIDICLDDLPRFLRNCRKQLDLWGNDYYLAHAYRTMRWWTRPTHVTVLGDLLGSQWIDDDEFDRRAWRFWNRVFPEHQKIEDDVKQHWPSSPGQEPALRVHEIGQDAEIWSKRLINVAGNHDVGYAGDLTSERIARFERAFGRVNYEMEFSLPLNRSADDEDHEQQPHLRIVVLNNMNLDTPAYSPAIQTETYDFINAVISTSRPVESKGIFTLLLTHIPLHKERGCVDSPFFAFHSNDNPDDFPYGVKEQNHLSDAASKGLLEGIFGKSANRDAEGHGRGRNGIILTGHDHEGCDVWHYINQTSADAEAAWQAAPWSSAQSSGLPEDADAPGVREVTVRSMMGDFGGNVGMLSLTFDEASWEWKAEFANCRLGHPWIWWATHVVDLITVAVGCVCYVLTFYAHVNPSVAAPPRDRARERREWVQGKGRAGAGKAGRGDGGSGSGSDTGSLSSSQRRGLRKSQLAMRDGGRRQLSAVFEVPE
jgi:hypothetical protein